jgi:hypothetical protein
MKKRLMPSSLHRMHTQTLASASTRRLKITDAYSVSHAHQLGIIKVPDPYSTSRTRCCNQTKRDRESKTCYILRVTIHPAQDSHRVVGAGVPVDTHTPTPRSRQNATSKRTIGKGADLHGAAG